MVGVGELNTLIENSAISKMTFPYRYNISIIVMISEFRSMVSSRKIEKRVVTRCETCLTDLLKPV